LAWKIAQSPLLEALFIAPGNPGTAMLGHNVPVGVDAIMLLVDVARRERIDLVVVGPEAPLAAGLADVCHAAGIRVFGPTAAAARIESSKAFAKQMMQQVGVPTAAAHTFDTADTAIAFARSSNCPWVVKADGLASGKGVIVADAVDATIAAIRQLTQSAAGKRILLEERMYGPEVSLIALCDGERLLPLLPAQDHKRLQDGDLGPNTGGMGAYAPASQVGADMVDQIVQNIMYPVVRALHEAGTPFCGALYAGVMLTEHGPQALEFNARFGDPETQALMPLIEGDLLAALLACAEGWLRGDEIGWREGAAMCVVLAADGYPEAPRVGNPISGVEAADEPGAIVFHSGTAWRDGQLVTNGGRVLGVTGVGHTPIAARNRAYEVVDVISFAGMQYRKDIGGGL
jgi:phosphoribosylamine--glycine ligase